MKILLSSIYLFCFVALASDIILPKELKLQDFNLIKELIELKNEDKILNIKYYSVNTPALSKEKITIENIDNGKLEEVDIYTQESIQKLRKYGVVFRVQKVELDEVMVYIVVKKDKKWVVDMEYMETPGY